MLLTYKYRLSPTKKQIQALDRTLETCRILYNSCLADRRNHYQTTGNGLSRIRQQEILTAEKKRILLLQHIHSKVLQNVLFRVDRSFQSFFRRVKDGSCKAGYPRYKGAGQYNSICYPQEPGFQLTPQGLRLSKIGTIEIKRHREIAGNVKPVQCDVTAISGTPASPLNSSLSRFPCPMIPLVLMWASNPLPFFPMEP